MEVWVTIKNSPPSQKCCCKTPSRQKRDAQLVVHAGVSNGKETMLRNLFKVGVHVTGSSAVEGGARAHWSESSDVRGLDAAARGFVV